MTAPKTEQPDQDPDHTPARRQASAAEDAELVALRVRQHDPRGVTLSDVDASCAVSDQPSYFGVLVIGPEVEVESALGLLGLIEADEVQSRRAVRLRADLELVSRGVDHDPPQRVGPPLPQGDRVVRVDDDLFPCQAHEANLIPAWAQMRPRGLSLRNSQLS